MALIMRGAAGEFVWNHHGWAALVRLAWEHGWRPIGTLPPEHWDTETDNTTYSDWPRADYGTPRGQRVRDRDARELAAALRKCLDDLPNHDALGEGGAKIRDLPGYPVWHRTPSGEPASPFELFGGVNKPRYRAFIEFCEGGGFEIW